MRPHAPSWRIRIIWIGLMIVHITRFQRLSLIVLIIRPISLLPTSNNIATTNTIDTHVDNTHRNTLTKATATTMTTTATTTTTTNMIDTATITWVTINTTKCDRVANEIGAAHHKYNVYYYEYSRIRRRIRLHRPIEQTATYDTTIANATRLRRRVRIRRRRIRLRILLMLHVSIFGVSTVRHIRRLLLLPQLFIRLQLPRLHRRRLRSWRRRRRRHY